MPYNDDDKLIRWILGDHRPFELGTLEFKFDEKDEYDEDKKPRVTGFRPAEPQRIAIGFMRHAGETWARKCIGF